MRRDSSGAGGLRRHHAVLDIANAFDPHAHDVARRRNSGGWRAAPMPAGVPVASTSPGSNVMALLSSSICSKMLKRISAVLPSCRSSPLTQVRTRSACGSAISSAVTSHGPKGPRESNDFASVMVGLR